MLTRFSLAAGLALLAALVVSIAALAKGGFSFIEITGPSLKENIRSTDSALTTDFFAFADFYQARTKAPADPGVGYEITRFYIQGKGEIAFDRLHYYPQTGLVFYDGIVNGSSEYDGEWYLAKAEIKPIFEKALPASSSGQPVQSTGRVLSQAQSEPWPPSPQLVMLTVISAGIGLFLLFASRRRKPSTH